MLGTSTTVSLSADGLLWLRAHCTPTWGDNDLTEGRASEHQAADRRRCSYLEVIHSDSERVHDFSIDGLILKVDQVHLLPDGLQRSLGAEGSQICTDVAVGLVSDLQTDLGLEAIQRLYGQLLACSLPG